MGKLKRLAGETVLYGLGSIVPRFLNFLLVSLHTDVFNLAQYGVITQLFAYVAVLNVIYSFGMETAYFRFANKEGADENKVFNLAQTVVITISLFCSIVVIIFAEQVSHILLVEGHEDLVILLVAILFIDSIVSIPFARLRLRRKPIQFAIGKIGNVAIMIGLNIYLLKFSGLAPDIIYVLIANLAASAFYLILFSRTFFSWRPKYDREISPAMFSYAYPVMLTGLAGMTNEMFSRISLVKWLPEYFYLGQTKADALGVFGACYKLAVLMNLAIQAFRYAAEPFFFAQSNEKNSPQLFARINHYFIIVCCVLLLSVSVNLDIIKFFLRNEDYWQGLSIVPILLLAYLFLGVYYNFTVWFKLSDRTYWGTIITVGGAVITIMFNFLLIPVLGYFGSSIATLICYLSMTIACYLMGQKYYPIPYWIKKDTLYIVGTVGLVYAVNAWHIKDQIVATTIHLAIVALYVAVVAIIERKQFQFNRA